MSKKATPRKLADNEALVRVHSLRVSPRKLNLLAQWIRGMKVSDAIAQLTFSTKRSAKDVKKALQSAVANAENNHGLDVDRLYVKEATVGKELVMKRFSARGRGRANRIEKPFSNLRVVVQEVREEA